MISVVIPLISSAMTLGGILLIQLPAMRNNMHREAIDQMYGRIMEARIRLENAKNKNKASLVGVLTNRFGQVTFVYKKLCSDISCSESHSKKIEKVVEII